jgi:hypothetical protein
MGARGGRVPGHIRPEVRDLALDYGPEAIKRCAGIMRAKKATYPEKLHAISILLNRAYGKAKAYIEHHHIDYSKLSDEALQELQRIATEYYAAAGDARPAGAPVRISPPSLPPPTGTNGSKH